MTNVFNIFVMLQVFNMINCRKVNDEKNIFEDITKNWMFPFIWILIFGVQVIIVEFSGIVFECNWGGLPWQHWIIALVVSIIEWPLALLFKYLPDSICPEFGKEHKDPREDESHNVLGIRKQRTKSFSLRNAPSVMKEGSGAA